jgi:hypothetical protein
VAAIIAFLKAIIILEALNDLLDTNQQGYKQLKIVTGPNFAPAF